ncbi:MAG: hypothetical protein WDN67_03845 [Candidatus Moraniibacteriota bacterium]
MENKEITPDSVPGCASCQATEVQAAQNEETSMAFLLALLPVLTLTFFGQVGLL